MHDLNSLSLNELLTVSVEWNLVERCRTTEWVVVLMMGDRELVMNHGSARTFLQGLIYGASTERGRRAKRFDAGDGWSDAASAQPNRIVVG